MFKFLKNKLKGALSKFTKEVEEEAEVVKEVQKEKIVEKPRVEKKKPVVEKKKEEVKKEPEKIISEKKETPTVKEVKEEVAPKKVEIIEEQTPEPVKEEPVEKEEKKSFLGKLFKKKETSEEKVEEPVIEKAEPEEKVEEQKKKEGFFTKLTKITLSEEKFNDLFWELEVTLLENNVAVEVIEKIKEDLKEALTGEKVARKSVEQLIMDTLKNTITEILMAEPIDLLKKAEEKKPFIITMIGVNGSGKTTTLAKLIKYFQDHNKTIVVAAADTFRAAAIQQLEEHTTKLGVKLIKHDYNADPAAVAFDAVKHATAKGLDIVLIDSAGRLHSNDNLMNELKKIIRINKPDMNIFVGEAITGNDCVEQAKLFDEAVGIDGIILAKADVDEKGGAAISASFVTKKPILFLGTGQNYEDLTPFKPAVVLESLGL